MCVFCCFFMNLSFYTQFQCSLWNNFIQKQVAACGCGATWSIHCNETSLLCENSFNTYTITCTKNNVTLLSSQKRYYDIFYKLRRLFVNILRRCTMTTCSYVLIRSSEHPHYVISTHFISFFQQIIEIAKEILQSIWR